MYTAQHNALDVAVQDFLLAYHTIDDAIEQVVTESHEGLLSQRQWRRELRIYHAKIEGGTRQISQINACSKELQYRRIDADS